MRFIRRDFPPGILFHERARGYGKRFGLVDIDVETMERTSNALLGALAR